MNWYDNVPVTAVSKHFPKFRAHAPGMRIWEIWHCDGKYRGALDTKLAKSQQEVLDWARRVFPELKLIATAPTGHPLEIVNL